MSGVELSVNFVPQRWISKMLGLAFHIANWSTCPPGRRHAYVIALDGRYQVASGYNGPPIGFDPCDCDGEDSDYCRLRCRAVHAEINCVASAARNGIQLWSRSAFAFGTKQPCYPCRDALANAGVLGAFWVEWYKHVSYGHPITIEAGEELTGAVLGESGSTKLTIGFSQLVGKDPEPFITAVPRNRQ